LYIRVAGAALDDDELYMQANVNIEMRHAQLFAYIMGLIGCQ